MCNAQESQNNLNHSDKVNFRFYNVELHKNHTDEELDYTAIKTMSQPKDKVNFTTTFFFFFSYTNKDNQAFHLLLENHDFEMSHSNFLTLPLRFHKISTIPAGKTSTALHIRQLSHESLEAEVTFSRRSIDK
jgi:hypothetical protein